MAGDAMYDPGNHVILVYDPWDVAHAASGRTRRRHALGHRRRPPGRVLVRLDRIGRRHRRQRHHLGPAPGAGGLASMSTLNVGGAAHVAPTRLTTCAAWTTWRRCPSLRQHVLARASCTPPRTIGTAIDASHCASLQAPRERRADRGAVPASAPSPHAHPRTRLRREAVLVVVAELSASICSCSTSWSPPHPPTSSRGCTRYILYSFRHFARLTQYAPHRLTSVLNHLCAFTSLCALRRLQGSRSKYIAKAQRWPAFRIGPPRAHGGGHDA